MKLARLIFAAIACWLLVVGLALTAQTAKAPTVKKLVSITIDITDHKLRWLIAEGHKDEAGKFQQDKMLEPREVDPDEATMRVGDEVRRFAPEEAKELHQVLDTLVTYVLESTVRWEEGEGEPVKKPGAVAAR